MYSGVIQKMVLSCEPGRLRMMSDGAVTALEVACREKTLINAQQGGFIYPGTKWCGPGNKKIHENKYFTLVLKIKN